MSSHAPREPGRSKRSGHRAPNAPAGLLRRGRELRFHPAFEQLEERRMLSGQPAAQIMHPTYIRFAPDVGGSTTPVGLTPAQVSTAYGFPQVSFSNGAIVGNGAGETIAIVDAYDDPTIVSDLHNFDAAFGLANPPSFSVVNQTGGTTLPQTDPSGEPGLGGETWEVEIALDVEWSHSLAPGANILLVEANSDSNDDLYAAVQYAKSQSGVVAVSMSWGGEEDPSDLTADTTTFAQPTGAGTRGVTFLAATGDYGAPSGYPAYSPNVVAVGGTTLTTDAAGDYQGEVGWYGSAGGYSEYESLPTYQVTAVSDANVGGSTTRTNPDVSFDADPYSGVAIYDSYDFGSGDPWTDIGGTSLATPSWAAIIAIADQGRAADGFGSMTSTQALTDIYKMSSAVSNGTSKPATDFIDITSGNNGYEAGPGYDLVTGVGSPNVPYAVNDFIGTFVVLSSTPERGATTATPPKSFTINFSDPYNAATLSAADFTVNNIAANSVTQTSTTTATFNFTTSPVTKLGLQSMAIAASAISDSAGVAISAYSAKFVYDTLPPIAVVSTTPANGAVVSAPLTSLVVKFNEAPAPASISTSNLTLNRGTVTKATLSGNTVTYTLSGLTTDGELIYSIAGGAITDVNDGGGTAYSGTVGIIGPAQAFPTPLTSIGPAGSLIYDGSVTSAINFAGDIEAYTLTVAAGESVSVVVTPASGSGLQPKISLTQTVGVSASASSSGANVPDILQPVAISNGGPLTLTITGLSSTFGGYTVAVYLNAELSTAANGGQSISTVGTAESINGSFAGTGSSGAQRGGAVGALGESVGPDAFGYAALAVNPQFTDISTSGTQVTQTPDDPYGDFYSKLNTPSFSFSFYGSSYSTFYINSNGFISLNNSVRGYESYSNTNLTTQGTPSVPMIAPLWDDYYVGGAANSDVYYQLKGSGSTAQLIVQWNDISYYFGNQTNQVTFEVILNANGTMLFNYKNLDSGDFSADGATSTAGIKASGHQNTGGNVLLVSYESTTSPFVGTGLSTEIGVGLTTADYYSFSATAGQTVTLAAAGQSGSPVEVTLENASGTALATGTALSTDVNSVVENFAIPTTGTYYVAVSGAGGTPYAVVVTRNGDFDTKTGTSMIAPQNITGTDGVLGSIQTATPHDWYSTHLTAGENVSLQISALGSTTAQFIDTLNPQIALYSPSGALLASGSHAAPIVEVAPVTGTYTIEVSGAASTVGEYYLSQTFPAPVPPEVSAVYVSGGSGWSADFYQYLSNEGLGNSLGYAVPSGASQLQILPWNDLTTVSVVFTQNVTVNTAQSGLALVGSTDLPAIPSLGAATFSYNSATDTATWTFAKPLTTDKYLLCIPSAAVVNLSGTALDGDWTNTVGTTPGSSFPSGNGTAGGDFDFRFNVVPGDVNGDGVVTGLDGSTIRLNMGQATSTANYLPQMDIDGDGTVTTADMADVRAALLQRLPTTEPTAPAVSGVVTGVVPGAVVGAGGDSASNSAASSSSTSSSSSSSAAPAKSHDSTSRSPDRHGAAIKPLVGLILTDPIPVGASNAAGSKIGSSSSGSTASADASSAGNQAPTNKKVPPPALPSAPPLVSSPTKPPDVSSPAKLATAADTLSPRDSLAAIHDALLEHFDWAGSRKMVRVG